jgi:hypothetical protein
VLDGVHILVVDDSPDELEMLRFVGGAECVARLLRVVMTRRAQGKSACTNIWWRRARQLVRDARHRGGSAEHVRQ